jgi:hypothetical protein
MAWCLKTNRVEYTDKTKEKVSELADFMETMKFLLDINTKTA